MFFFVQHLMSLIPLHDTSLYIGDVRDANDASFFANANIRCVVNATKTLPNPFTERVSYHNIRVNDDGCENSFECMFNALPSVTAYIHDALNQRKPVLVHCHQGVQRSAAVVAAYCMRYHGMDVYDAIDFVRRYRTQSFSIQVNFIKSLQAFEVYLRHM